MHRTNPLSTFAGAPSGARPGTLPHSPGASSGARRESSCARRALRLHGGHPPELVRHRPAQRTPSCPRQAPSDARRTPSGARLARSSTSLYSGVLLRALNEGPRTTPWSTRRVRRGQRRSNRRAPQPTETRTGARPSQQKPEPARAPANGGATASEDRTGAPGPAVGMAQQILWIQPYGSGRRPYWIPRSSSRRRMVTGPG